MSIINISSKERNIMSLTWQKKKKRCFTNAKVTFILKGYF